jgi:ferredoxin
MKFTVTSRCSGHARCYSLASEVYREDVEGNNADIGRWVEVEPKFEDAARLGARSCPEDAIIIEES